MANSHVKRCSMSLVIREIQVKTTMKYYLTPVRMASLQMAVIKKSTNSKSWRECEREGNLPTLLMGMKTGTATMKHVIEVPSVQFSSVQLSSSVVSTLGSLRPHESQHTRPPCPSPTPGVH